MKIGKKPLFLAGAVLFVIVLIWSRFFNLQTSARFIWDESSDLVRMKELFTHPKLTLIGPMSEDGVKIFGSLTYYLSLPFVILFKFDPVSPVAATAFFGILTVILFLIVGTKLKLPLLASCLLLLFSNPLIEAARWAWNPHFIPFWQIFGIIAYLFGGIFGIIFSGLFFGLTVHHHYYGIFALAGFGLMILINKKFKNFWFYGLGVIAVLLPFVIFDLTHPPGLFLSRMLFFSPVSGVNGAFNLGSILNNLIKLPLQICNYLAGENQIGGILVLGLSLVNIYLVRKNNKWLIPVGFQILGLSVISGGIFNHYLLPLVIFYYLWLLSNYQKNLVSKVLVWVLIVVNLVSVNKLIYKNDWSTNIKASKEITKIMADEEKKGHKFNLAVLASPDPNTIGRRYRDLLSLENINTVPIGDYSNKNNVFFISYKDWGELKNDPSYELNNFRDIEPDQSWKIDNSFWKVYLFRAK